MKAKHSIARIKGLSIWQKIFCTLVAVTLIALMIPSGLRANATTIYGDAAENENGTTAGEVNSDLGIQWPRVDSTVDFTRASLNSAVTAGYFTKQTAEITVAQAVELLLQFYPEIGRRFAINSLADIKDEMSLAAAINAIDQAFDEPAPNARFKYTFLIYVLERFMVTGDVHEDITADMTDAVWVPHIDPGIFDSKNDGEKPYIEIVFEALNYINSFVVLDAINIDIGVENRHILSDSSSIVYGYVTLGQGSLVDILLNTTVHINRLIPIIPAMNIPHAKANAFQSNGVEADENVQAFFMSWDVSFDAGRSFIPVSWLVDSDKPYVGLENGCHYVFRANFWDVEGLVQVHLDFDNAIMLDNLAVELEKNGWWSTDVLNILGAGLRAGSHWTTVYPEWMPTAAVYADIFETFGDLIFEEGAVVKDRIIAGDWQEYGDVVEEIPYPGPHWMESDNDNYFGAIGKETTIKFSWYPISPVGEVNHATIKGLNIKIPWRDENPAYKTRGYEVSNADVMYYNEWGMPLFDYHIDDDNGAQYGELDYWTSTPATIGYYFLNEDYPDYCYDQQIDHAVIKAYGSEDPKAKDAGTVYIPLRVDADMLHEMQKEFVYTGLMNFDVEALMFANFAPGFPTGLDSYDVTFYEDGEQLFDTLTLDNFWAMTFFSMPMTSNSVLSVEPNGDIVSSFAAYFDYWRPWADDPLRAFKDPVQFDPTPGVYHNFQCRIHVNPAPGYIVHGWNYDYLFHIALGDALPITDFVFDEHVIAPDFMKAATVNAAGTEGHATFRVNYFVDDSPTFEYDFVGGADSVYAGTKFNVQPDGTLLAVHVDGGIMHDHNEGGLVTAVPIEGYQLSYWTINGVDYPLGTTAEAATASVDNPTNIVANYVPVGGGTPVNPEDIGGGTAQTSDGMGFAFAILAMIAIAGAGVLAGRKLYNK